MKNGKHRQLAIQFIVEFCFQYLFYYFINLIVINYLNKGCAVFSPILRRRIMVAKSVIPGIVKQKNQIVKQKTQT